MNEKEGDWIDRCVAEPTRYRLDVDNDDVSVYDIATEEVVYFFNSYGYEFALGLLIHIGCNAEMV